MKRQLLKKLSAFIVATMLFSAGANAQIVYTDVDPDLTITQSVVGSSSHDLDINNDGIIDATLTASITSSNKSVYLGSSNGSQAIMCCPILLTKAINSNTIIGADASGTGGYWANNQNARLRQIPVGSGNPNGPNPIPFGDWSNTTDRYIALRFAMEGQWYYGWIRVSVTSNPGISFTVRDYAYNGAPNAEIIPGYTYPGLDATIQSISGIDPNYCAAVDINPAVVIKNMGATTITALQYSYDLDGGTATSGTWSGNLATGERDTLTLGPINAGNGSHVFHVSFSSPNGETDENLLNDAASRNFTVVDPSHEVTLNITLDNHGSQITWDVATPDNVIVHSGGPYAEWSTGTVISSDLCIVSGCYTLTLHDSYNTGICCESGNGDFELLDADGTVLINGDGSYLSSSINYFCAGPDHNDASIESIDGIDPNYCGAAVIEPTIVFKNNGTSTINTFEYSYQLDGEPAINGTWSGILNPGQTGTVTLDPIAIPNGSHVFNASCSAPNGGEDENSPNNTASKSFTVADPGTTVTLNITTDDYGSETTWEIVTSDNTIALSGGPYYDETNGTVITSEFCLGSGCYTLTMHDQYGDGMCCEYGNGDFELLDSDGSVLVNGNGSFLTTTSNEFCLSPTSIHEAGIEQELRVFPNPNDGRFTVLLPKDNSQADLIVRDAMGREVFSNRTVSARNASIDLQHLPAGIYYLEASTSEYRSIRKINIVR